MHNKWSSVAHTHKGMLFEKQQKDRRRKQIVH
jgi:hypothetical protein